MRRVIFFIGMLVVSSLMLISGAAAETPEDLANRISGEIMSPYCPGVTLHDCPSDAATEKRLEIEGWARSGWSEERILAQLEDDFGSNIRANPSGTSGLWAWAIPAAVLGAGVAGAVSLSKRWTQPAGADAPVAIAPEDHQRVESDLEELRKENLR